MNRYKSILGLHIDDDFLNIVHLGQTANGLEVHNSTAERLEAGIIKDGLIINTEIISQKISNFVKANQLKSCKVIMSLPCSAVRFRPSEFPKQTDEQLQKQVQDQVGKYSLFEGQEIVFDYCIFEESVQSTSRQTVLQAVTTRQVSDACLAVARKARLDLVKIEPAVLPIMKLVFNKPPADSESISLLLALDTSSANISVFKNRLPQFYQNLTVGIKDLSKNKDGLTCLIEQMKPVLEFAHSLANSQKLVLRVAAACDREKLGVIVGKIKQSLGDVTIEQIYPACIGEHIGVKDAGSKDLPIFAFASALAGLGACESTENLNLVSQESLSKQRTQKEMSLTAKGVVVILLLSIVAKIGLNMKIRSAEAASADIETKATETMPMKQKITGLKKQIKQLEGKLSTYAETRQELTDTPWPEILQVIGDTVPDEVRIVEISTADSTDFKLIGEALAESYVYKFAKKLQDDEFVESAKVEEIEYDNNSTGNIVDYKIACKIVMPEGDL